VQIHLDLHEGCYYISESQTVDSLSASQKTYHPEYYQGPKDGYRKLASIAWRPQTWI